VLQMKIRVKSDEELFDRWKEVAVQASSLKGIVQNDMHISPRQLAVWKKQVAQIQAAIARLTVDTVEHIAKCNGSV